MGEEKILNHKISEKPGKKRPVGLIIMTFVLALCLGALIFLYFNQKTEMIEMEKILTEEKDSLANELSNLMFQYDTLKTNNESLNAKLETEQNKIKSLLNIQASNAQKIRLYKKELATLRKVMKSYIVQIDSLNTKNIQLTTENIEVRKKLEKARETNVELSQIKEDLSAKVEMASVILAKNILATPINTKGKERNRIERIDKIRVCFTLRENPIVEAGKKDVFMRIARPDELILADSPDNLFEFEDEQIVYSSIRTVDYLNQDVDMCIYWNNNGDLIPGNFTVYLYLEGNNIGSTTFLLK
ncbi:MAG: hypothetical protein KAX05_04115 [Bacteroidales bacterium]|nr:hypothetical protein [Bacteroidales bacterium]